MDRMTALNQGLVKYKMDTPCRKGHIADRYASTGQCVECAKKYQNVIKANRKHARTAKLLNLTIMRFAVHPDDVLAIDAYITACSINRRMLQEEEIRRNVASCAKKAFGMTVT